GAPQVVRGPVLRRRVSRRDDHDRHVGDRAGEDRADGEDRARRGGAVERGRRGRVLTRLRLAVVATAAVLLAGCPKKTTPPPTPEPSQPPIAESPLPPSGVAHFEIGPI